MLTGKQRSYLKGLANGLDPAVYIGKNELTDTVTSEMDNYLTAPELVKVKVHDNIEANVKALANEAAEKLGAEYVQAIGRRFVLYRKSEEAPQIVLPR